MFWGSQKKMSWMGPKEREITFHGLKHLPEGPKKPIDILWGWKAGVDIPGSPSSLGWGLGGSQSSHRTQLPNRLRW